ncbi:MAG: ribonuclease PH [Candidatus Nanoarchaeia archaeon]
MRSDGRKNDQMREMRIIPNFLKFAEGSALVEFGKTRVLCSASVLEEVPPWMRAQKKSGGWLTSEYQMLPASTQERSKRETTHISGRTHEIQRLVGRSLRAAIDLEKLGPRTIYIDCEVLDADGGTRCASINGGMASLAIAVRKLMDKGIIQENPITSYIGAISVGIVGGKVMLDLCYEEDSTADTDMNVVMNDKKEFIEVQATAEHKPFNEDDLTAMLKMAKGGILKIIKELKSIK